jgi:hypothetical protein
MEIELNSYENITAGGKGVSATSSRIDGAQASLTLQNLCGAMDMLAEASASRSVAISAVASGERLVGASAAGASAATAGDGVNVLFQRVMRYVLHISFILPTELMIYFCG